MSTATSPGRGAWTLTGGLLPAKPGAKSTRGYYRLNKAGEPAIGSAWANRTPSSPASADAQAVWYGVQAIQSLVGAEEDGEFGPETSGRVIAAQTRAGIEADGIVGVETMKALLGPLILDTSSHNAVPNSVLAGILMNESSLDPGAVGVNGLDHGLAQINLGAHPAVSLAQAMDPDFSIMFTAMELFHAHDAWLGRTTVDPWWIAIANHNSPLLAVQWAVTGIPPFIQGRAFQIGDYVQKVLTAWTTG